MPDPGPNDSAMRVADLFRMRNADRLGLTVSDTDRARDAELNTFGESLGLGARGGSAPPTPAMPGKPVVPGAPEVPAGDALSSMAPPMAGSQPTAQTDAMRMRADPAGPGAAGTGKSGIPALDALTETPKKRNRGLYHNRRLGRVMGGGM